MYEEEHTALAFCVRKIEFDWNVVILFQFNSSRSDHNSILSVSQQLHCFELGLNFIQLFRAVIVQSISTTFQIAKAFGSTSARHRSDAFRVGSISNWCRSECFFYGGQCGCCDVKHNSYLNTLYLGIAVWRGLYHGVVMRPPCISNETAIYLECKLTLKLSLTRNLDLCHVGRMTRRRVSKLPAQSLALSLFKSLIEYGYSLTWLLIAMAAVSWI